MSCLLATPALAQLDATFAKANEAYAHGRYQEAIKGYGDLVAAKQWSAPLFYNLGNAYFRTGDFAHAILDYERALALEPQHPEAAANLAVARDEARALELQKHPFERLFTIVPTTQITIAAMATFWVAVFAIMAAALTQRRRRGLVAISIAAVTVFAGATAWLVAADRASRTRAIITRTGVEARVATADTASSVLALPPGSEIRIVSERGDWIYAELPNNLRGWIPADSTETVRL